MDKSEFKIGHHYRRRGWSYGNFVTCTLNGCVRSWTRDESIHDMTFADYYECSENGLKIEKPKFKVGDTVIRAIDGITNTTRKIIEIKGEKYITNDGWFKVSMQHKFDLVELPNVKVIKMSDKFKSNLCREIKIPEKVEGKEMKETNVQVEVKVDGKVVGKEKVVKTKTDLEKKPKYIGEWYDTKGVMLESASFESKKHAKRLMQEPQNIGKTLVMYKASFELKTNIPVVETEI